MRVTPRGGCDAAGTPFPPPPLGPFPGGLRTSGPEAPHSPAEHHGAPRPFPEGANRIRPVKRSGKGNIA